MHIWLKKHLVKVANVWGDEGGLLHLPMVSKDQGKK